MGGKLLLFDALEAKFRMVKLRNRYKHLFRSDNIGLFKNFL